MPAKVGQDKRAKRLDMTSIAKDNTVVPFQKDSPNKIKFSPTKREASEGTHLARIVHVEPAWSYFGGRKVALYFQIIEGDDKGAAARKFYRLNRNADGEYEVGPKSNLARDAQRLFPELIDDDGIDPVHVFKDRLVEVDVVRKQSKSGASNAIVTELRSPEVEF